MTFTLQCRKTRMGAETKIVLPWLDEDGHDRIRVHDVSRTGNHWSENIDLEEGEVVWVRDVTNSGKHECWSARVVNDQLADREPMSHNGTCEACE